MEELIAKIKRGEHVNLRDVNVKLPQIAKIECESEDYLIDLTVLSKKVLKSSPQELISLYICLREDDEFWERIEMSYHELDHAALDILRLVSVVYEKSIDSPLAYESILYQIPRLEISLEDLTTSILNVQDQPDLVRALLEIYTLKRRRFANDNSKESRLKQTGKLAKALYTLQPPEVVWNSYQASSKFPDKHYSQY